MNESAKENTVGAGGAIDADTSAISRPSLIDGEAGERSRTSIILGHDRQPQSKAALAISMDLADRLSAHLHVVHAIDLGDAPIDPDSPDWENEIGKMLADERAEIATSLRGRSTGWSYHVGHGDPARLLASVANERNAVMIVIGSRGEGFRASVGRLGSAPVSHRLVQHANRPVLVVRSGLEVHGPNDAKPD